MKIATTPQPPYYAVIFTSVKSSKTEGYNDMAIYLDKLLTKQPGFLGYESAREEIGITVSYWASLEDIKAWKGNDIHSKAQEVGKRLWYDNYSVRIAKVEKEYSL